MIDFFTSYLKKLGTFSTEEMQVLAEHTEVEIFKKGDIVLREGEVSYKCYFVAKGCVRQYQLSDGDEKTTAFFTENQAVISYSSYLNLKPSEYFLACLEDTVLVSGTKEQEEKMVRRHPNLKGLLNIFLVDDFARTENRLAAMIKNTPEERLIEFTRSHPELMSRVPLYHIASYLGITPESFSRIRKRIMEKEKTAK